MIYISIMLKRCVPEKLVSGLDKFKGKKYSYFVAYTLLFAVMVMFVFRYFLIYDKTFIDGGDGISQHFNVLLYYSKLLKKAVSEALNGRLCFPMWDFRLGLGEDILQVLNYHEIGDPLSLICLICPNSYIDYCYTFIFLLRLYLGGLAFSWFSIWHGNGRAATLMGSFIYIFSGYTLVAVMKHLMFGIPILTFPLILLGVDKIFRDKKGLLFGLSIVLAALGNFYLLYIQGLLTLLYIAYRYCMLYGRDGARGFKEALPALVRCLLYGGAALLMSMVVMLPVMDIMLSANRIGADNDLSLLYPVKYYLEFMADYTNMQMPGAWTNLGFPPLALSAVIIMFLKGKKYFGEKLLFVVLTAFALIPFFGYVFNGFGYVTNRWIFAYSFLNAYIFAKVFPEFKKLDFSERRRTALIMLLFTLLPLIAADTRNSQGYCSTAVLMLTAVFILCADFKRLPLELSAMLLYFIFIGSITFSMWGLGSPDETDTSLEKYASYHEPGQIIEKQNSDKAIDAAGDEGYYRIREIDVSSMTNSALNRKYAIPGRYFSLLNNGISSFLQEMYYNTTLDYRFTGSENRSILDALLSVKYYTVKQGSEDKLPFNYRNKAAEAETYDGVAGAYAADIALPIGYTYDSIIPERDFYQLSAEERQEAMLEGAVTPEGDGDGLPETELSFSSESVLKNIEVESGKVDIEDGCFVVRSGMSVLRLELDSIGSAETCVVVKGLSYRDIGLGEMYSPEEWRALSPYERSGIRSDKAKEKHLGSAELRFGETPGNYTNKIIYYTPYHMSYTGHSNFMVNMGYSEEGLKELYLFFPDAGYYSFERFDVICQRTGGINRLLEKLSAEPLEDIVMDNNMISGRVRLSRDKFMVLSLPYSKGWKAYVDGQEQELVPANIMFMGLKLNSGEHDIVLRYETPCLRLGAYLTLVGFVFLVVLALIDMVKYRKNA